MTYLLKKSVPLVTGATSAVIGNATLNLFLIKAKQWRPLFTRCKCVELKYTRARVGIDFGD